MSNITIIGLDRNGVYLEDLRVEVPYQTAVTLPAQSISSRKLADALNNRRLFQLKGTLPSGASFRGGVAVPRSTSPPPRRAPAAPPPSPTKEKDDQELREAKAEAARLQKELDEQKQLNAGLQQTLAVMSGQLTSIHEVLEDLKKQGVTVNNIATAPVVSGGSPLSDDAPRFIPSVKRSDVKDNISVRAKESTSSLGDAKTALKALRKKKQE